MSTSERRGSVTVILQNASSYCLATSPRDDTNSLPPDCWDDGSGKKGDKAAQWNSAFTKFKKGPNNEKTPPEEKEAPPEEKEETKMKSASPSAKRKGDNMLMKAGISKKQGQKMKDVVEDAVPTLNDSYEKVYDLMVGRSEVYSRIVEALRKSCEKSEVLLGLPETPKEKQILLQEYSLDEDQVKICRSSFTVAMAAAKMRLHYERALAQRTKRRAKPGKKVFEDAFVSTWSQPILAASMQGFSITFEKAKKPRIVRVSKLRRKSLALELPKPVEDEAPREEAEWAEWRRVHDRVTNWLADNAQVDADESHIIAMLMEADQKKSIFLK